MIVRGWVIKDEFGQFLNEEQESFTTDRDQAYVFKTKEEADAVVNTDDGEKVVEFTRSK